MVVSTKALLEQFPVYGLSMDRVRNAVYELYSDSAIFKDPAGINHGREEIIPAFQAVQAVCSSVTAKVLNITENDPQCPPDYPNGAKVMLIEAVHTYKLKPTVMTLPFRLFLSESISYRAVTKYVLDSHGRILLHEELWSFAELLAFLPFGIGFLYDYTRLLFGKVLASPTSKWFFGMNP